MTYVVCSDAGQFFTDDGQAVTVEVLVVKTVDVVEPSLLLLPESLPGCEPGLGK